MWIIYTVLHVLSENELKLYIISQKCLVLNEYIYFSYSADSLSYISSVSMNSIEHISTDWRWLLYRLITWNVQNKKQLKNTHSLQHNSAH